MPASGAYAVTLRTTQGALKRRTKPHPHDPDPKVPDSCGSEHDRKRTKRKLGIKGAQDLFK